MSLEDHFAQVAAVTPLENGEDLDTVKLYKYRAGRNSNKCSSLRKQFQRELPRVQGKRTAEQEIFEDEQLSLLEGFADLDDDNTPIIDQETGMPQVSKAKEGECKAALRALKAKHPQAVQDYEDQEARVKHYMEETVPVELFTISWRDVPAKVTGTYVAATECMLTDLPHNGGASIPDGKADD